MGRNIVLIGFMGTGKTSVGRMLAKKLGRDFVDVDSFIEERQHRKIAEIFEKEGEAHFRKMEKEAIRELSAHTGVILTTGGGAVLDPENIAALKRNGVLVCLSASPEMIFKRVRRSEGRPLLRTADKLSEIKRLLERRAPFYRVADFEVNTDGQTPEQTAVRILQLMEGAV